MQNSFSQMKLIWKIFWFFSYHKMFTNRKKNANKMEHLARAIEVKLVCGTPMKLEKKEKHILLCNARKIEWRNPNRAEESERKRKRDGEMIHNERLSCLTLVTIEFNEWQLPKLKHGNRDINRNNWSIERLFCMYQTFIFLCLHFSHRRIISMWCNNIDFAWIPRTRNEKHFSVFVVFRLFFFVFVRSCPCVCVCMCVTWFGFDDVFLCCHCIALHHNVRTYVRSRTENKNLRKQTTENDKSQLNEST